MEKFTTLSSDQNCPTDRIIYTIIYINKYFKEIDPFG